MTYRIDQDVVCDLYAWRHDLATDNIHRILTGDIDGIVTPPRSGGPGKDGGEERKESKERSELARHLCGVLAEV